ncbi:hypothetical protein ACA910_014024 [Epithemia clementina (nom. ined.)]
MVTSPTSPVTYRPSLYELLCNAKIEINRKYLESIGLEKAASELKKRASPSQKENKTVGKKSSLGNVEDAAVTPTRKTRKKSENMCQYRNGNGQEETDDGKTMS